MRPAARTVIADQVRHQANRQERAHGVPRNNQNALPVANTPISTAERWGLGCGLPMRARKKRQAGKTPAPPETWDERCLELRWTLVPYRYTGAPLVVVGCGNWQRKLASIWSGKLLVAAAM